MKSVSEEGFVMSSTVHFGSDAACLSPILPRVSICLFVNKTICPEGLSLGIFSGSSRQNVLKVTKTLPGVCQIPWTIRVGCLNKLVT